MIFYNRRHQKGAYRQLIMKNSKTVLSLVLTSIAVSFLLVAVILIVLRFVDDARSRQTAGDLQSMAESRREDTLTESTAAPTPVPEPTASPKPTPTAAPSPQPTENPYRDSFLANSDMAAWLQVPGTVIDYPVMWTPGDENYYLKRGFDGKSNQNGCLILDTDSSLEPLTTNLIIHGHNMKSGAMFGDLSEYESEEYCQEHKSIILYTESLRRNYEVIAVFRSQVFKKSDNVFKFYKFFQADSQEEFDDFYDNIMAMSIYDTGVTAQFGDHFLTLSTCSYHVDRGRFVVVAKEVESGESYLPFKE